MSSLEAVSAETPYQVLVIDDDIVDRLAVRRAIKASGLNAVITEADSAAAAIEHLAENAIDCALLEYQLPDSDGLSFLRTMRQAGSRTPIIMLTGQGNASVAVEMMKAGAADYLTKSSIALDRLSQSIRNAVRIRRAEAVAEAASSQRDILFDQLQLAMQSKDQAIALLDTLFATAPVGFAFFDTELRYVRVNDALATINGLPAEEHVGRTSRELFPDLPATVQDHCRTVLETGVPMLNVEVSGRTREATPGPRFWLANYYPIRRHDGTILGIGAVIVDITDRKHAERELIDAREAAEAASRSKDQFLAVLSHELRTPLTPVLTTVAALESDTSLSPELHGSIEMIRRNVELEARLIDDLLDLTRIAKGKLQLNFETIDVHKCLRHALDICRNEINARGVEVIEALHAARRHARGDPARLQQVLWNLIKNAVRFTPAGGKVTIGSENPSDDLLRLYVADTGIGIEQDLLPKIFNAFQQGEQTLQRKFGGLGLGLAISKSLVELHGGTISAASAGKDRGARFEITIATAESSATSVRGGLSGSSETSSDKALRILMVDDHEDTGRAMQRLLQRLGYDVHLAHTCQEAIDAVQQTRFNLLISDIGLPDGSGLDLIRALRSIQPIRGIALSGFGMDEDIRRSKEAGFYDHLTKPINFHRLETVIRQLASQPV